MSRGRGIGQKLRARRGKHGYVHRLPLSERYVDEVAIAPGYQFLPLGTPTATFTVTRTGEAVLPASVRWRSGALSGLVEWEQAETGAKTIVLDTYDASADGSVFEVSLFDPEFLRITQGTAQVELEEVVYTTPPYPIQVIEGIQQVTAAIENGRLMSLLTEAVEQAGATMTAGELRSILRFYDMGPEAVEQLGATMTAGELRQLLRAYDMGAEAVEQLGAEMAAGELRQLLIRYENYPPEAVEQTGATMTAGTLA